MTHIIQPGRSLNQSETEKKENRTPLETALYEKSIYFLILKHIRKKQKKLAQGLQYRMQIKQIKSGGQI